MAVKQRRKQTMKKISIFATALLLAWGCVNDFDENIAPEGTAKGAFNVIASADNDNRTAYSEVDGVLTASWKAADKIDVISVVDGAEYEALTYTADAAGTKVAFSPAAEALTLKEGGQNYKFYAYYQWWKHNNGGSGDYGLSEISYVDGVPYLTCNMNGRTSNWGIQGSADYSAGVYIPRLYQFDVLWAKPEEVTNPSGDVDLDFQFNHAFAVLELKLTTTGSEDITLNQIQVDATGIIDYKVKVNLATGELTNSQKQNTCKMNFPYGHNPTLKANGANSYSCYMTILPGHAGKKFTITVTDQNSKTYTFEKTPSKDILAGQRAVLALDVNPKPEAPTVNRVEKGVASTTPTKVWVKKLSEIDGVLNHLNVNGLAVSGDYLLLSENGNSNPVYLDALTGEKKGTMDVSAVTAKSANYYATNDEGGYIWISTPINRPTDGGTYYLFAADNVTSAPAEMFTAAATNIERYGAKISVSGSKADKALVATPYFNSNAYSTKYVRRFYWDGSTTTRVEQFVPTGLTLVADWNWADGADAMNASADKGSDLFTIGRSKVSSGEKYIGWSTLAWHATNNRYQGTKVEEFAVKYADSQGHANYTNSIDYVEFNNAKYLAYNTINNTTSKWGSDNTFLVEIGESALGTPVTISGNHNHGAVLVNAIGNTTFQGDVQLHASADGNYLYAYVMFAGGEVACYRYTCLAE